MIYVRKQNAPPAEGQENDVLLVLDKQQGKVSSVKGFDKEGNLQTVPPITPCFSAPCFQFAYIQSYMRKITRKFCKKFRVTKLAGLSWCGIFMRK